VRFNKYNNIDTKLLSNITNESIKKNNKKVKIKNIIIQNYEYNNKIESYVKNNGGWRNIIIINNSHPKFPPNKLNFGFYCLACKKHYKNGIKHALKTNLTIFKSKTLHNNHRNFIKKLL
jgi:hypothetical protein